MSRALYPTTNGPPSGRIAGALCALAALALACSAAPTYVLMATAAPTRPPAATATAFLPASPMAMPTRKSTPTATPSPSPSPSPTATPQPTLTPTFTLTPEPTATPTVTLSPTPTLTPIFFNPDLPAEAAIPGISGADQALPLSCEARSAVDWAAYFGILIDELEFQYRLDTSDNPNQGFVGDPNGLPGQIPPFSYGVHAPPVAKLLREYGLSAQSRTGITPDDLRLEVSQGRPVIAWVIGHVWLGYSRTYTAADGTTVLVAPYEHTVIVTAYTRQTVTVLDGSQVYTVPWEQFLASWAVLGNMGVVLAAN